MSQVCRGLQAAHQQGLIHRDLKPSNIFVMDDDTAKDHRLRRRLPGRHETRDQDKREPVQYMSPEQIQMKEITPASDIFALGVILYESLTGRKPFAWPHQRGDYAGGAQTHSTVGVGAEPHHSPRHQPGRPQVPCKAAHSIAFRVLPSSPKRSGRLLETSLSSMSPS